MQYSTFNHVSFLYTNQLFSSIFQYHHGDPNVDPPQPSPKGNYGTVSVSHKLNLLSTEGRATLGKTYKDVQGSKLPTFEALRQRGGLVLYETTVTQGDGLLKIEQPRDLIFVFVDGVSFCTHLFCRPYRVVSKIFPETSVR